MDQSKETVTVTESNFVIKEKGILRLSTPGAKEHYACQCLKSSNWIRGKKEGSPGV